MRVLVTGGAGFIGSHVAEAHLDRGDEVWIVDDLSTGKRSNVPDGAEFIEMDIVDPRLGDVFSRAGGFDIVSHHAAQMDVRRSVADPLFDARVNVIGFLNVAQEALRCGVGRFIFVSSGGVLYGEAERMPTPEATPKRPESPYGVTKLTAENYLQYYQQVHGLEYVAMRYANVYGPRQDPHGEAGVVAIFSKRIAAGEPITIFGDGEQTRDYVFVGDVVAANIATATLELPKGGTIDERAFNVGTSIETSVLELAHELMRGAGREVEVRHAPARPGELTRSCLDTAHLRSLGWQPRVSLPEGLGITYHALAGMEAR